jgi:8-oxo-dGTP pyrophosphatase MutT (NUDIX family)
VFLTTCEESTSMGYGASWREMTRFRFDDNLRAALAANLDVHQRRATPLEGRRHAAVAVVIVDSDPLRHANATVGAAGGAAFLLCLRAVGVRRHAGQWALPGGSVEPGETPLDAALRELHEELGVRLGRQSLIGWLDDYPTRSGYVITPIVLWGVSDPPLKPAQDEVLAVYRVTLETLISAQPRFIAIPESDRPVLQLPLGEHLIHPPTGAILYQLRQVGLLGRTGERVDELEQPVFAWS